MKQDRRFRTLRLLAGLPLIAVVLLASCKFLAGEDHIAMDCGWDGEARAWLDKNGNGIWDANEAPLAGVRFFVDDTLNHYTNVGKEAVTNRAGRTSLSVWLPGCPAVEFEIYATPPAGYRLTTQARVPATGKKEFAFGFVSVP